MLFACELCYGADMLLYGLGLILPGVVLWCRAMLHRRHKHHKGCECLHETANETVK